MHWRDDASDRPIDELVDSVGFTGAVTAGPVPAIVVGGTLPDTQLQSLIRRPMDVETVATARWFPGFHNGAVLVVVDNDALVARRLRHH